MWNYNNVELQTVYHLYGDISYEPGGLNRQVDPSEPTIVEPLWFKAWLISYWMLVEIWETCIEKNENK